MQTRICSSARLRSWSKKHSLQMGKSALVQKRASASEQPPNSSLEQTAKTALGQLNESGSLEAFDCTVTQLFKSIFVQLHH
jgi:hypothetical protein